MGNTCYCIGKPNLIELHAQRSRYYGIHHYETVLGKAYASFGFLLKGCAEMDYGRKKVNIPEGSLFYLPSRLRYRSIYTGNPNIEFIGIHLFGPKTELVNEQSYALQVLPEFSNSETLELLNQIILLLGRNQLADQLHAIGAFLLFYAEVLPHLHTEDRYSYPSALLKAMNYIEEHRCEPFSMNRLCEYCYLSSSRLYAMFQQQLHTSPLHYLNQLRVEKASELLRYGEENIREIAWKCGFSSDSYFREVFKQYTGISPSNFRKKQKSDSFITAKAQRTPTIDHEVLSHHKI